MSNLRCLLILLLTGVLAGCQAPAGRRVTPAYDPISRELIQLAADTNGDRQFDQWTYLRGSVPLRGEADLNGDGRIDRWEYFDERGALSHVGTSSLGDGIEDTWSWPLTPDGEARVDRSRGRDRHIDRREYYRGGVIVRAVEDSNFDGLPDRWDYYEAAALRRVEFDTTNARGQANRRMVFDTAGRVDRVEADPEFDGSFVPLTGEEAKRIVGSGGKQ